MNVMNEHPLEESAFVSLAGVMLTLQVGTIDGQRTLAVRVIEPTAQGGADIVGRASIELAGKYATPKPIVREESESRKLHGFRFSRI